MQTIGKADNKMDFPLNWTDVLLKSISGKTNYTIDVKIGTKRIATNQDLRDNTKKRRKQSNPTRISSNEENAKNGSDRTILFCNRSKPELNNSKEETDFKLTCPQYPSASLPLNLTISENQKLSPNEVQKMHFSNDVQLQNDSFTEISNNLSSSYQTFIKEMPYIDNKDNYSIESSTCMMSFSKQQPCTSTTNVGPTSVQIFNPEAFCDQCNKEFCNKYFLKTHKANKHGVFSDSHSNSSSLDQLDKIKISTLPTTCDFSSNINDNYIGASTSSLFKSPVLFSQSSVNSNTCVSKNIFNNQTRAFCSICQKEFCNKYFVRRHKAKIHGITDDGDYKINDDVSLNFKTNVQIKNEFLDFGVTDSCDKDVETVSPSLYANKSISEITKKHDQLFLKGTQPLVDNEEELVMKYTAVETPHNNIKVENTDDEQNVNYVNKLKNKLCNVNELQSSELTSNLSHIISTHNEKAVIQNDFSKVNAKGMNQQHTEFKTNTNTPNNLMTNNSVNGISDINNIGQKINILNNYLPATITIVENTNKIDKNIETDESKIELMSKSKLLTLHNLFFKFNGNSLENMSTCYVCNMQINGSLKAHIFNEHENIVHELMSETLESNENVRIEHSCHECHQIFNSDALLKEHVEQGECNIKEMGRTSASSKNSAENEEYINHHTKDLGERKQTMLSSFCKICNKELCNKYFMKTHMQRMHGISIQNGNHIGGVVCDICNKELCSKYFLRVHKQNSHGIVENGSCQKYWTDSMTENGQLSDEPDNGHRYYKHYTEVCNICLRRFRSSKWLSAHLLNDHGSEGKTQWKHIQNHMEEEKQNMQSTSELNQSLKATESPKQNPVEEQNIICDEMKQYRCSYCSFTTSILSFLFVHEKFHLTDNKTTKDMPLTCPTCSVAFQNKTQLENHFTHCHFNSDAGNSPVPYANLHSPDNTHVPLNVNEDLSADKSLDNNGNDVFTDKLGTSIKPRQTENVSPSIRKNHRIPESNHEPFIMQSFFLENCSVSPSVKKELSGRSDSFHSSLVYLPVKEKLTSTVNVFFKLTPT
ncbi:unnamed protein product [Macrosiphum euphorbiae]|uniref:C2H2-type domain-containing protein n=1 Tax=Macrosiphum euphorbiae TaxID=13131 RepID=A0AAV0WED3_9HEMI|nr:unnamed protein product [Macrosiphum euphorbiae]